MNDDFKNISDIKKKKLFTVLIVLCSLLSLFFAVKVIGEIKNIGNIGRGIEARNIITVSGEGEAYANPNIAEVTFDITQDAGTVAEAQKTVSGRTDDIMAYLKSVNIDKKDIQTVNYSVYPKYESRQETAVRCLSSYCPPVWNQVLVGYTVTHSMRVKIRNLDDAGKVLSELGTRKVSNISNLNFVVENDNAVQSEAREKAIAEAKEQAKQLAKDLGVRLVRIVQFSENNGGGIYYQKAYADMASAGRGATAQSAPAANIAPGQNKYISNVTITYEIR